MTARYVGVEFAAGGEAAINALKFWEFAWAVGCGRIVLVWRAMAENQANHT
jgi:hypothetical protein